MKISKLLSTVVFLLLVPRYALAVEIVQDYAGITPVTVGAEDYARAFFTTTEYPARTRPGGCLYELYYIKLDTPGGRAIFATVLNAKNLGKKLVRFDWNRVTEASGAICYVSAVITQD